MKPLAFSSAIQPQMRPQRAGVALVLVLSFLVIISGLIIAFFSMVTTEASSAGTTAAAASAKTLADSAVSFVMGTIVDATMGRDPDDNNPTHAGPQYAWVWASQPGMIRTYDNGGAPKFVYKLFSADKMKLSSTVGPQTDTTGLTSWAQGAAKDVWVDLNEPVKVANGSLVEDVYPIVDPRAAEDYDAAGFPGHEEDSKAIDHKVAGFKVLKAGSFAEGKDPNAPAYDPNNNNPAPMPVKWLYVLQDGTMTAASLSGQQVTLNGTAASATNPIKGRIAFWTDDESSKVNINTASVGTYWDTPHVMSDADGGALTTKFINANGPQAAFGTAGMGLNQPTKGEFQRYPGHPATVSLAEIFGFKGTPGATGKTLKPVLPVPTPAAGYVYTVADAAAFDKYYALTPRLLAGGSKSGTAVANGTLPPTDAQGKGVPVQQGGYYRLYSAVDELMFDAIAPGTNDADQFHRIPNLFTALNGRKVGAIPYEMLQKAKFFLTANSSAPEVTLYNTPRVSMWPVNDNTPGRIAPQRGIVLQRTPFDETAKFCATVGSNYPFYFMRFNSRDQLADYTNFSQNVAIYKYLQALTSLPVPGATGNGTFATKYPVGPNGASDRDQILTCIYDYIRCTNLQDSTPSPDPTHPITNTSDPLAFPYRYTPVSVVTGRFNDKDDTNTYFPGAGEVMPIRIGNTQGFGRYDTVASAYLLFFAAHGFNYGAEPKLKRPAHWIPEPANKVTPEGLTTSGVTDAMGVVFMLSFFNPSQGQVGNHQKMCYRVANLDRLVFTPGPFTDKNGAVLSQPNPWTGSDGGGSTLGATVFTGTPHTNFVSQSDVRTWHGRGIGGTVSPIMAFMNGKWKPGDIPKVLAHNNANGESATRPTNYPFYGYTNQLPVPPQDAISNAANSGTAYYPTKFKLEHNGPDITVETYPGEYVTETTGPQVPPVQTLHFRFPTGIFRIPPINAAQGARETSYAEPESDSNNRLRYQGVSAALADKEPFFFNTRTTLTDQGSADGFVLGTDTVLSLEPAGTVNDGATTTVDHTAGDQRMYGALKDVPASYFQPNFSYGQGGTTFASTTVPPQFAHNMQRSVNSVNLAYAGMSPNGNIYKGFNMGKLINTAIQYSRAPDVPRRVSAAIATDTTGRDAFVTRKDRGPGSWDTGMGLHKDGPFINKPDEGDQNFLNYNNDPPQPNPQYRVPYIDKEDYFGNSGSYFSPNRQIPSSMMLGSIPTGIQNFLPWQTLLFHPPFNDPGNPGLLTKPPADHYMADLFWMPMVEPYAISQPFSTAGKINMNYQIQPFTYIKRTTGMRALMASTRMPVIASTLIDRYKPLFGEVPNNPRVPDIRFPINLEATMTMLDKRFNTDFDIYRSATEISTVPLIPRDTTIFLSGTETYGALMAKMNTYWGSGLLNVNAHQATGNNLKDKPYADIYGRLTTKSNAFTVHVRAQALRKANSTPANQWVAGKDQVVAEYRGSTIIERYIDANDPLLPDFAALVANDPSNPLLNIDQYYKFRVVSSKRFAP